MSMLCIDIITLLCEYTGKVTQSVVNYRLLNFAPIALLLLSLTACWAFGLNFSGEFYLFLVVGFVAQMIDGALGLGFGMVSTSTMIGLGISPTAISSSVHSAEVVANVASGISHHANGNVNRRLFKALIIPGIIGAIGGAILLKVLADINVSFLKGVIAGYTAILGVRLLVVCLKRFRNKDKATPETSTDTPKVRFLAWIGGFMDSFGGGGWGPIVTTTLVHQGHNARYVIGTVNAAEFFISLASALSFLVLLQTAALSTALPLILGSVAAAPLAAKITGKLSSNFLLLAVATVVVCWSVYSLQKLL